MLKFIKQFGLWLSLLVYGAPQLTPALLDEARAVAVTASSPSIASLPALAGATAIVAAISEDTWATTIHGLNWVLNDCDANSDIRLIWTGSNLLSRTEHTVIWRYNPHQQSGYYAVAWSTPNTGAWDNGVYSYGTHPWPGDDCQVNGLGAGISGNSGSAVHCWEEAGVGTTADWLATAGVNPGYTVVTSQWYTQARRVHLATSGACNGQYQHDFFPDLDNNPARVISICLTSPITGAGSTPAFYFGGSDWEAGACGAGTNDETLAGKLRGIQLYSVALSDADVLTEAANQFTNAAQTSTGISNLWYINQDPIPSDITDKKTGGTAHTPTWANASRPTQFDSTFSSGAAAGGFRTLLNVGGGH